MTDEILEERCDDCNSELVRTSADDEMNPHHPHRAMVTCPDCLSVVRLERPPEGDGAGAGS